MHPRIDLHWFRLSAFAVAAAALSGCASMSSNVAPVAAGYGSAGVASAYASNGYCYAPPANLDAAYNQPYQIDGQSYYPMHSSTGYDRRGTASWYGWESGTVTAMGTAFRPRALTAASRTLPLPCCARVTNLDNGRSVVVLVDDRGPFVAGRIMDLSYGAAQVLGMVHQGTAEVQVQVIPSGNTALPPPPQPEVLPVAQRVISAPPPVAQPRMVTPVRRPPPPASPAPRPLPAVQTQPPKLFLQTAQPMNLNEANRERRRLNDFGISTAVLVPVYSHGQAFYRVRIGPLAPNSSPATFLASLRRLQLGDFSVATQYG
ncbi:septal ring lytic transglycosylase RlpA family protein [Acidithiobacillus sp.]